MNDYSTTPIKKETFDFIERYQDTFIKSKATTSKILNYHNQLERKVLTPSLSKSIHDCGSWLEFREYHQHDKTVLHHANFCKKDKLCPACATRRAAKQVHKMNSLIESSSTLSKKYWYYIVLPVKHDSSMQFEEVFGKLRIAKNKLRQQIKDNKRSKGRKSFMSQFDGIAYSYEVTHGKNGWNCHLNLLCCTDTPIQDLRKKGSTFVHDELINDWLSVTGDSYVVSIKPINKDDEKGLLGGILEVFKYVMKFQKMTPGLLLEVYDKTRNIRLYGTMGSMYGLKLDVDLDEKALTGEYTEFIYRYLYNEGKYIHHSTTNKIAAAPSPSQRVNDSKPCMKQPNPPKYIKLEIFDSHGALIEKTTKINLRGFSDFQIFSRTMTNPPFPKRRSPAGYRADALRQKPVANEKKAACSFSLCDEGINKNLSLAQSSINQSALSKLLELNPLLLNRKQAT